MCKLQGSPEAECWRVVTTLHEWSSSGSVGVILSGTGAVLLFLTRTPLTNSTELDAVSL